MTVLPEHLELIVQDARTAAGRSIGRSRRRRARARIAAVGLAALVLGVGLAGGATDLGYVSLVERIYPGAQVTDLGDRQHRVLAALEDGSGIDVVVTDLGVTETDRPARPGSSVCDWVEADRSLHCSTASETNGVVPAGTHVYRINPASASGPKAERSTMLLPALRMQLVVDPTPVRP